MGTRLTITKNTFALITREGLSKGALFILVVLIGRFLGKEALGRYSLALVISQIFFFGTELGLNTLAVREVAKDRLLAGKILVNMGILRVLLGIVTMGLIWLTAYAIGAKGEAAAIIYLCGISCFFSSITTLYTSIFRAFEKMELDLFIAGVKNIIFLPLAIWMLFKNIGLIGIFNIFLITNILALILANIIFIRQVGIPRLRYDFSFLKEQLMQTLPLWISQLFGVAYLKLASILLFRLKGEGAVGLYNAGFLVIDGFYLLAGCFACSVFPLISRMGAVSWPESREEYFRGLRVMLLIFLPLAMVFILTGSNIIRLFFGEKFIEIAPLFKLLIIAAILGALDVHNNFTIIAIGKQALLPFIYGVILLINFILNFFFIPKFSYMGSAYALTASEVLVFIFMMSALRNFFKIRNKQIETQ